MNRPLGLIVLAFAMLAQAVIGEEIYRTVDEQGNVTFTDTPPAGGVEVERVELPSGPSEQVRREAEQRNQKILNAAERAEQKREQEKAQKQTRVKAAEQQLQEAQAHLAEAKVIKDEDRQNLAGGKRRINPDYFERVKQAELEVEQARKALREARGY
ncbi:MAG: DUF4124 domain-containing protein [Candidatus Thiodiazotropha sp.]|jgi:hypothetical protein